MYLQANWKNRPTDLDLLSFQNRIYMLRWSAVAQMVEGFTGDPGLLVRDSPPSESLCFVLEQDTLSTA